MPSSLSRRVVATAFVLLVLICTATAQAHPNHGPSWGERYLKLDVAADGVRVVYGVTFVSRFGRKVRTLADADRNGRVDGGELELYGEAVTKRLAGDVQLTVAGDEKNLEWSAPFLGGLGGPLRGGPVTLETTAKVPLQPGTIRLLLEDGAEFDGIYRTTASIAVAPEVALIKGGRGPAPPGKRSRLVFLDLPSEGVPPPRVVTALVELPGTPNHEGNGSLSIVMLGIGTVLLVGICLVLGVRLRHYRRKG